MNKEELTLLKSNAEKAIDKHVKTDLLNRLAFELRNVEPKLSLEYGEKALALSKEISYKKGKAESLSSLGFYNLQTANNEKAFQQLLECLELFEALQDEPGIGNAFYNLGILHLRLGSFDDSIEVLHKSLAIREKLNDKSGQASCYFQLSYINQHFNDQDGAYEAAQKSLVLRRGINDKMGEAASLLVLSDVYFRKKDFLKAKELIEQCLELRKGFEERLGYYATLNRLAIIYIETGELDKARKLCVEGVKLAEEYSVLGVIRFLQALGKLETKLNNTEEARKYYEEALHYADKVSFKSIEYELHQALTEIYELKGDYKKAFEHYRSYHTVKEEVINMQSTTRLKSLKFMNQVESARREADLERVKNDELKKAYGIIEEKNKDITDSIRYAKRIQTAILPKDTFIQSLFPESFVLFKPKDIVSGDFYWASFKNGSKIIVAADCTGHGVPGAFMSMTGSTLLNEVVNEKATTTATGILSLLRERLMQTLQQTGADGESKDGMDIALCVIDGNKLEFAGANNPLYIINDGVLKEYKGDKQPIGVHVGEQKPFISHSIELQKGDSVYIFTDGFADQFGGPNGKKFLYKRFQELLLSVSTKPMDQQKQILDDTIESWKQGGEQIDDILVIGLRP